LIYRKLYLGGMADVDPTSEEKPRLKVSVS